jgi:hypothetical protein
MKDFIFNSLSIFAGKRFARIYRKHGGASLRTVRALNTYRALRRKLPITTSGNHLGNHGGSQYRPFCATQGDKVRTFSSPLV